MKRSKFVREAKKRSFESIAGLAQQNWVSIRGVKEVVELAKKDLLKEATYACKYNPHLILLKKERFDRWFGKANANKEKIEEKVVK